MKFKASIYLIIITLCSCKKHQVEPTPFVLQPSSVLDSILRSNTITISTQYNTTAFYVYQGYSKGFHYELLKSFAKYMDVKPTITQINNNTTYALDKLSERQFDLYAATVTSTEYRKDKVLLTEPLFYTDMVLVQRKKEPLIKDAKQLAGAEIVVLQNSLAQQELERLADSLKIQIFFIELSNNESTEDMLNMIDEGLADYTVVDSHIANTFQYSMHNITSSLYINKDMPVCWALDKYSPDLLYEISEWIKKIKNDGTLNSLYKKYFENSTNNKTNKSIYLNLVQGTLSPFDKIIKQESKRLDWDWRLLASIIYVESNFNPEAISERQAYGLMQVLEETAYAYNGEDYITPEGNIHAGVSYLLILDKIFSKFPIDSTEKIKFMLAAYNAGPGHVRDAQRLARKYDRNPNVWEGHVDYFMLNKSKPVYYLDSLSKHGYCNGKQVYNYVNKILDTYNAYKHVKD